MLINSHDDLALPQYEMSSSSKNDLVCFSHLRWDFVCQRPQHLLKRAARERRVFFVEEPIFDNGTMRLETFDRENEIKVVVPHLPEGLQSPIAANAVLREMMSRLINTHGVHNPILWYYTPMALSFTSHLASRAVVYDCMDELSAFKHAPDELPQLERELFSKADLVFTGGKTLFEAKRLQHSSVHCFPSSIEREHFARARELQEDPADQKNIPHPRLGFFGVIDERLDIELLQAVATAKPEWNFVMLGPIVKIDPASLPQNKNIHYLGSKRYEELPQYIASWDVAVLWFALNDATRFISPTKTPEYLAAGKPVVSTPITDVVEPYGTSGLVEIAGDRDQFIKAVEKVLDPGQDRSEWLAKTDAFLAQMSWDSTWEQMSRLIDNVLQRNNLKVAQVSEPALERTLSASLR